MNEREMIEVARPCVRNELNRCEQLILSIEKSKPTPAHLNPAKYLEALNDQATRLRTALDSIDTYLGLTPAVEKEAAHAESICERCDKPLSTHSLPLNRCADGERAFSDGR